MSRTAAKWYQFQNLAEDPTAVDIHIVDFIGSWDDDWFARNWGYEMGVTARAFIEELVQLPDTVNTLRVHINSPGGDVQGGVNIANALREQQRSKGRTVETFIDGMAASIASVIAMAGSKIHIADNALVMVHNPWSVAIGEAGEMRKVADILDSIRGQIVATYRWHSPLENDAIAALMDAETWMDADQAIANGFATDKVEGLKAAAAIDRRALAKLKVPDQFRARVDALLTPEPSAPALATAAEVIKMCRAAGFKDIEFAEALIGEPLTPAAAQARVAAEKQQRGAAAARAEEIRAVCATAKLPELAEGYIAGGIAVADVRKHLTFVTAKLDKVEIDTSINPDQPVGSGATRKHETTAQILARRRGTPAK